MRKTKKLFVLAASILFLMTVVITPLLLYFTNFPGQFSPQSSDWANFGSYLSGTVGSILSTASVIALVATLYKTSKDNRATQALTLQALEKTDRQITLMNQEFKVKLLGSYIDNLNQLLAAKKYTNRSGSEISQDEFFDDAYHRLAVNVWARMSNKTIENTRNFDPYLPGNILADMGVSFSSEARGLWYVLDLIDKCEDEDLKNILIKNLKTKTSNDALFWLTGYSYISMQDILSRDNRRLYLISDRAGYQIIKGAKLAEEGAGAPQR